MLLEILFKKRKEYTCDNFKSRKENENKKQKGGSPKQQKDL